MVPELLKFSWRNYVLIPKLSAGLNCHLEVISFVFGSSVSHQYHLDFSGRTRGVFNGASRFADSVWIGVLSAKFSSRSLCGGVAFERLLRSFETNFWLDADP